MVLLFARGPLEEIRNMDQVRTEGESFPIPSDELQGTLLWVIFLKFCRSRIQ